MSIQGELAISIEYTPTGLSSEITSTRPLFASRLFSGKSIEQTLHTIPLLFNICAKAQAVTAVRAIESALQSPGSVSIESHREAVVAIESLREHSLQILMDWPSRIDEALNNEALSNSVQSLNKLMASFDANDIFRYGACLDDDISQQQRTQWTHCSSLLSGLIFGMPVANWQHDNQEEIERWATQKKTQAARFIAWLGQQDWKYSGHSTIKLLPEINDAELRARLITDQPDFIAQPDWESACYEASWFNRQQAHSAIKKLTQSKGNGIYTRTLARLVEVSDLMNVLQGFFIQENVLEKPHCQERGLANTDAARGRLLIM